MGSKVQCTLLTQVMCEMTSLAYLFLALSGNQVLPKINLSARMFMRNGCRKWLDLLHFPQLISRSMRN
nr:hypothetical protein Iba_chr02aCG1310 [Ipomoea batatas]GMC62119.1 hypothetical protein Iba_chr02cCG0870 [Ipomoea batatas]GMC67261.1 hypothetical protein Iba_chr02fCG0840 [Ipomoea batatas]